MNSGLPCFLLLCLMTSAISGIGFNFEAKRKKKKSFHEKLAIGVSYLRKYHNLPKIPKIPEAKTKNKVSTALLSASNFNPCKITQLCQNGGKCVAIRGAYYCQCTPRFYGKTCEFLADSSKCLKNLCQNDATCYSVKELHPIIVVPAEIKLQLDTTEGFNKSGIIQRVQYECWCKPGFTGSLCEYSEDMRQCEEDYCLHKGIGRLENVSGVITCKCICEENYGGERCQIVLPCMSFKCENGGICENVKTSKNGEEEKYVAKCRCPAPVDYGIAVLFKGEHCELIQLTNEKRVDDECFPCKMNAANYLKNCIDIVTQKKEAERLRTIIEACDEKCKQSKSYCQNGGECVPEGLIIDAKTNRSALLPACHCQGLDEGLLCEDAVRSPCDKTSFDPRGPEDKCGKHGNCVAKTAYDYICDCDIGWTGDKCEVEDPCRSHKCSEGSLCVALPIEQREKYSLGYTCICDMNQEADFDNTDSEVVKCVRADFGLCKNHECKNEGKCYPCDESDLQNLQLCTDEERRRGFRCICPYGLLLPFCDKQATACTNNKCLNGAQCVVDPQNEFNYICNCRLGYSGQFCESQVSPCVVQGLKSCVMGTCVEDANFIRGFACECLEGYEGLNCDLAVRADFIGYLDRNYWWTYPLIMMLILSPIIMILSVMSENSAKREYELKKAEKERNEDIKRRREAMWHKRKSDVVIDQEELQPNVQKIEIRGLRKETAV
ncbi:Sperm transmembrane protein 9 [Toxocara canis]|uniref:Sperm transmembrane protein 9 n=1 Tax=Toxocara canis TaxID=6265 RepID=A0A0B2UX09_TOXCA|nr:Sperm transmembrane protein 9 [Toxocara canis]